jgi:4'-phosphopantetheinyl transferase
MNRCRLVVPPLDDSVCQVWWARPTDAHPYLDRLLDQAERKRRNGLLQDDRERLTVGAALTRLVLACHLDCPAEELRLDRTCRACGAQHGKPRLRKGAGNLQFSIAHSGSRIAVAVIRGAPVGVDVEQIPSNPEPDFDAVVTEVLSEEERSTFKRLPSREKVPSLLAYWTSKEALLKATGDGLRIPMATITVSEPGKPLRLQQWSAMTRPFDVVALQRLHPGPGYVAALAVLRLPTVRVQELDAGELLAMAR